MRYLIVVRHASADENGRMSHTGSVELASLIEGLRPYTHERSVYTLTSPAPRATDTAENLSVALGGDIRVNEVLFPKRGSMREQLPAVLEFVLIHEDLAEVLIVVTHSEYVAALPQEFWWEKFNKYLSTSQTEHGEGFVIDCETLIVVQIKQPIH